jgi:hypothetical protein
MHSATGRIASAKPLDPELAEHVIATESSNNNWTSGRKKAQPRRMTLQAVLWEMPESAASGQVTLANNELVRA